MSEDIEENLGWCLLIVVKILVHAFKYAECFGIDYFAAVDYLLASDDLPYIGCDKIFQFGKLLLAFLLVVFKVGGEKTVKLATYKIITPYGCTVGNGYDRLVGCFRSENACCAVKGGYVVVYDTY